MEKIIKPVAGYLGYHVSNYGEVYSMWEGSGRGARIGSVLRPIKTFVSEGRCCVGLSRDGKRKLRRVHQLVLEAFVGPKPQGMQGCHFPDRSTSNNRLDNLRWDTHASNQHDRVSHGTTNDGERNGSAKLKKAAVRSVLRKREKGATYKELAAFAGVSVSNIQQICQRKTWKTIGE